MTHTPSPQPGSTPPHGISGAFHQLTKKSKQHTQDMLTCPYTLCATDEKTIIETIKHHELWKNKRYKDLFINADHVTFDEIDDETMQTILSRLQEREQWKRNASPLLIEQRTAMSDPQKASYIQALCGTAITYSGEKMTIISEAITGWITTYGLFDTAYFADAQDYKCLDLEKIDNRKALSKGQEAGVHEQIISEGKIYFTQGKAYFTFPSMVDFVMSNPAFSYEFLSDAYYRKILTTDTDINDLKIFPPSLRPTIITYATQLLEADPKKTYLDIEFVGKRLQNGDIQKKIDLAKSLISIHQPLGTVTDITSSPEVYTSFVYLLESWKKKKLPFTALYPYKVLDFLKKTPAPLHKKCIELFVTGKATNDDDWQAISSYLTKPNISKTIDDFFTYHQQKKLPFSRSLHILVSFLEKKESDDKENTDTSGTNKTSLLYEFVTINNDPKFDHLLSFSLLNNIDTITDIEALKTVLEALTANHLYGDENINISTYLYYVKSYPFLKAYTARIFSLIANGIDLHTIWSSFYFLDTEEKVAQFLTTTEQRHSYGLADSYDIKYALRIHAEGSTFDFQPIIGWIESGFFDGTKSVDREELYNLRKNPEELVSLISLAAHRKNRGYEKHRNFAGASRLRKADVFSIQEIEDLVSANNITDTSFRDFLLNCTAENKDRALMFIETTRQQYAHTRARSRFSARMVRKIYQKNPTFDFTQLIQLIEQQFFANKDKAFHNDYSYLADKADNTKLFTTLCETAQFWQDDCYDKQLRSFCDCGKVLESSHGNQKLQLIYLLIEADLFTTEDRSTCTNQNLSRANYETFCQGATQGYYQKGDLSTFLLNPTPSDVDNHLLHKIYKKSRSNETLIDHTQAAQNSLEQQGSRRIGVVSEKISSINQEDKKVRSYKGAYDLINKQTIHYGINRFGAILNHTFPLETVYGLIDAGYINYTSGKKNYGNDIHEPISDWILLYNIPDHINIHNLLTNNHTKLTIRNVYDACVILPGGCREDIQALTPLLKSELFYAGHTRQLRDIYGTRIQKQGKHLSDFHSLFALKSYILTSFISQEITSIDQQLPIQKIYTFQEKRTYIQKQKSCIQLALENNAYLSEAGYHKLFLNKEILGNAPRSKKTSALHQGNIGDCYLIALFGSSKYKHFFEPLIRLALQEHADGWEVTIPLDDPNGKKVLVTYEEVAAWSPDHDTSPNSIGVNSFIRTKNDTKYTIGYSILEIAFGKYKNSGTATESSLKGGNSEEAGRKLFGNQVIRNNKTISFSGLNLQAIKQTITYLATHSSGTTILNPFISYRSPNGDTMEEGETKIFNRHGYIIEQVRDDPDHHLLITVNNPHDTESNKVTYTLHKFLEIFNGVSILEIDILHMFDLYEKEFTKKRQEDSSGRPKPV